MTTKAEIHALRLALGRQIRNAMPADCAFVLLIGIQGTGEQTLVANIPEQEIRDWMREAAGTPARVSKRR